MIIFSKFRNHFFQKLKFSAARALLAPAHLTGNPYSMAVALRFMVLIGYSHQMRQMVPAARFGQFYAGETYAQKQCYPLWARQTWPFFGVTPAITPA